MLSVAILSLSLALAAKADSWGAAFSLGPTSSAVIESTTTFNPGTPPSTGFDYLFLWPGISNGSSGLIQAGTDFSADQNAYCGATSNQWCAMASYFGVVDGVTTQLNGDMVPIDANSDITIHYKLGDDQVTWTQTVTYQGAVISTLESYDGPLYNGGWGTGTECDDDCTGSTSDQYYTNTTITLLAADPDFSQTLGKGEGVVATDMVTADEGKTWTIESIMIPAMVEDTSAASSTAVLAAASSVSVAASSAPVVASSASAVASSAPDVASSAPVVASTSAASVKSSSAVTSTIAVSAPSFSGSASPSFSAPSAPAFSGSASPSSSVPVSASAVPSSSHHHGHHHTQGHHTRNVNVRGRNYKRNLII